MIGEQISSEIKTRTLAKSSWRLPPADLKLESSATDVWMARLDTVNTAQSEQIISDDERARAARFRFETDRKRFIAARAFLRIILGKYLQINPRQICFQYNKYGKPSIGSEPRPAIKFNLSHSDDLALFAVNETKEIGVDIERIKSSFVDEAMASQCLTGREIEHFQTLSETAREIYFFDCWTRKEAYLKARGNGFSLPPNQIETSLLSELSTSYFENDTESRQIFRSIEKLPPIPGYATALAIEGDNPSVRFWRQFDAELAC